MKWVSNLEIKTDKNSDLLFNKSIKLFKWKFCFLFKILISKFFFLLFLQKHFFNALTKFLILFELENILIY